MKKGFGFRQKPLSSRALEKKLAELRASIRKEVSVFGAGDGTKAERRKKCEKDILEFGKIYFPHYLQKPSNRMHRELAGDFRDAIFKSRETGEGTKESGAAPRGNAKSTLASFITPLYCIAYDYRKYIVLLSDATLLAASFVDSIQAELEENVRLRADFPEICGEGPTWRRGEIVTKNGVKVQAFGSGKRLRGARSGADRPDLVIADDLENDENVESLEQRQKLRKWFGRAVLKVGRRHTVYILVGTVLHPESLLAGFLKTPGWKRRFYQAVIKWSDSPLWSAWEKIFAGGDENSEREADAFFEKNKTAMLADTKVLWPEEEPYYYLMKMRAGDGEAEFNSEKQNLPLDPKEQVFSIFHYYEGEPWRYAPGTFVGSCDPSMGKNAKKGDYSAIIILWRSKMSGKIYVVEADVERRAPDMIYSMMEHYHALCPQIRLWRVEETQFQEFFKNWMIEQSRLKKSYLPIAGYRPSTDKKLRIIADQPHVHNGTILFKKSQTRLIEQYQNFRKLGGGHDDGPDALNIAFTEMKTGAFGASDIHTSHTRGSNAGRKRQRRRFFMRPEERARLDNAERGYARRIAGGN